MNSLGAPGPFLSKHARQRCTEMGVEVDEVLAAVERWELRYPSPPEYGPDRMVSVAGRLAVVHTSTLDVVITVLWRGREGRAQAA